MKQHDRLICRLTLLVAWCFLHSMAGCTEPPAVATVDGPEAVDLADGVRGYIVTNDTGHLTAISLPDKRPHVIRTLRWTTNSTGPTIHSLSGPDQEGRIAYVEDHFFVNTEREKQHLLKVVLIDGSKDTTVFARRGSAMWATTAAGNGEIGSHLALAPTGGRTAFISRVENRQMPGALLNIGRLEIWNLADNTGATIEIDALDEPMSWFPDGKRIAYATLTSRRHLPKNAAGLREFGTYFGQSWQDLPAIYIYDVKARTNNFLHVGWKPVVSLDGKTVLVGGWQDENFSWFRVDMASGKSSVVKLPGVLDSVLGLATGQFTVYIGLPTTGSAIQFTKNNSPLRGPKQMLTVKVADQSGDEFQTIVPFIDPRSKASFGLVK